MTNNAELKTINLDMYESLEKFIQKDKNYNIKVLKANVTQQHSNSTVEFLRYFIV